MYKKLASVLWLCAAPLFAQAGHSASMQMQDMPMEKPSSLVPQLLQGVASRAPLKLQDFLALADRNNPTLQQAAAIVRRSEAEASQASLYPNPTVGYEGDQIRGGSYGGGEQGGFVAQTVVLGGKLGLRRDIYQQQKQSDQIAAQAQLLRVHSEVTQMFYHALSAQQTVLVRGRLLGLANDAVLTARQLANVGQADSPDVLQAEVEAEQASIDYTVAQRLFLEKVQVARRGRRPTPATEVAPLERGTRRATRHRPSSDRRHHREAGPNRKAGSTGGCHCPSKAKRCSS